MREPEAQGHPHLLTKFEANLSYRRRGSKQVNDKNQINKQDVVRLPHTAQKLYKMHNYGVSKFLSHLLCVFVCALVCAGGGGGFRSPTGYVGKSKDHLQESVLSCHVTWN